MTQDGKFSIVKIQSMVVADARCEYTVTMYNADGSVYTVYKDSLESYTKRTINQDTGYASEAFMIFADSAYAYLHRNDQ